MPIAIKYTNRRIAFPPVHGGRHRTAEAGPGFLRLIEASRENARACISTPQRCRPRLLRRPGASELRKWHLRLVPSSSKIDKKLLIKNQEEAMQRTKQLESPAMRTRARVDSTALAGLSSMPLLA